MQHHGSVAKMIDSHPRYPCSVFTDELVASATVSGTSFCSGTSIKDTHVISIFKVAVGSPIGFDLSNNRPPAMCSNSWSQLGPQISI